MILLLVVCSFIGLCQGQAGGGGGPPETEYVLNFESAIYVCPDEKSMQSVNTSDLQIFVHNETASSIGGNMFFIENLPPNSFRIEVIAKKEVSGKLEVVVTKEICDLCEELHTGSEYWKYIRYFGLPPQCPFAPGIYTVAGFAPHKDDLPINSSNSGYYIVEIYLYYNLDGDCDHYENQIFISCLKLEFVIDALE